MNLFRQPAAHRAWVLVCAAALLLVPARVPAGDEPGREPEELFPGTSIFTELFKNIGDWDPQYEHIARAMEHLWAQNKWEDEADLYARDLVLEVARIPPWEMTRRIDKLMEMLSKRYDFTPEQSARFRQRLVGEAGGFLLRHAAVILKQAHEVIQTRGRAEPFTPEQVSRWTRENEPLIVDGQQRMDRFLDDLARTMTPQQRAILRRDRQSGDKRLAYLRQQRAKWAKGEWKPADWGLQDDPIQRGVAESPPAPEGEDRSPEVPRPVEPTRWAAHASHTWIAYVREFEMRYGLDPAQVASARSIHAELLERATAYERSRADQLAAVPEAQRGAHSAYEPIRRLFSELRGRLEALRTTGQQGADAP